VSLDFEIDEAFVSRLVLGALSEHEQRMLAVALARSDPAFRRSMRSILEPFETFDSDLTAEYSAALDLPVSEIGRRRREILGRSLARVPDMEMLIHRLTVSDAMSLGKMTRQFFSWSMAELLLERSRQTVDGHRARTSSYLALMVIDMVELLGVVNRAPHFGNVVADVRQRIRQAAGPAGGRGEEPPS